MADKAIENPAESGQAVPGLTASWSEAERQLLIGMLTQDQYSINTAALQILNNNFHIGDTRQGELNEGGTGDAASDDANSPLGEEVVQFDKNPGPSPKSRTDLDQATGSQGGDNKVPKDTTDATGATGTRKTNDNDQKEGAAEQDDRPTLHPDVSAALRQMLMRQQAEDAAIAQMDSRINDPDRKLPQEVRQEMTKLAHAILFGSNEAIDKFVQQYKDKPAELQRILNELKPDMHAAGVEMYNKFERGMLLPDGRRMPDTVTVTMHDSNNRYVQYSTSPITGPITGIMYRGSKINAETGNNLNIGPRDFDGDPAWVMSFMGQHAITEMNAKRR